MNNPLYHTPIFCNSRSRHISNSNSRRQSPNTILGMGLSTLSDSEINSSLTPTPEYPAADINMTKVTTTTDRANNSKRKGTRSVSTLTPSQLARKRANDREAQRAIRARTKEHIESLERQVDDLRANQGRDPVVQELLRRNKALEDELRRLRESLGLPPASSGAQQQQPGYQSAYGPPAGGAATCTRTPPLYPTAAPTEYQQHVMGQQQQQHDVNASTYNNIHDTTSEAWHQASMQSSIGSTVSSPSSRGTADEFVGSHNFISAPASMPPAMSSVMSSPTPSSIGMKAGGGGFEDIKSEFNMIPMTPGFHAAQHNWNNMYPVYYTGSPTTAAM